MSNTSGMPSINMMGLGRGWDPHGTMPPQHPHGAYGFSGPGGMMATYGMQGGMPMGLIPMDGQGPGFDSARIDMTGYQDHMYRGEESFRDRKSTRLNSSHALTSRMPSSA